MCVTQGTRHRHELKEFLRARREALRPESVGLPAGMRRRTPGLRREEVALLAGVGVTWYTWLEQGRDIVVSREALSRIGRALRLTPTDLAYLFSLGAPPAEAAPAVGIDRHVLAVVNGLTTLPALVLNPRFDVLAFNALADEVFQFGKQETALAANHAWRLFMDPVRQQVYADSLDAAMSRTVGILRANYATRIGDPPFEELLTGLRAGSERFARMWDEQRTASFDEPDTWTLETRLGRLNVTVVRFFLQRAQDCVLSTLSPTDDRTAAAFLSFGKQDQK
jgi:transcriptional regulator with XRE-family HTH domain